MRRFKRTAKRIVKHSPTCKSPFVMQCVKQFPKIPHVDGRGNNISASTKGLSVAIHKALHAHGIHMDLDVSKFVYVQPHLVQQLNGYEYGIIALKFMNFGISNLKYFIGRGQDAHVPTPASCEVTAQ
ncbi:hypothetical protein CK203_040503 [Vitis vinifera]|uniref:Ubiquitin-like protease family profile domain-containing protein n=1 Tax=Vitis vinifera TaxID=29760 RepID=A0A438I825_VITVI|nr:hypothetical protein CK203_040503 [Vitis vinifera]